MASFNKCIKSAGLNDEEIRIFDSSVANFQAEGLSAKDAQRKAAESRLEELNDDKTEIQTKITESLPEPAITEGIQVEEITDAEEQQTILEEFAALSEVRRRELQAEEVAYTTVSGREIDIGWREATSILRNGKPAIVHRGASESLITEHFDQESLGKATGHPTSGLGIFLTSDHGEATRYGTVVESVHLDIRNPKIYTMDDTPEFASLEEAYAHRESLKTEGFDGIIFDLREVEGPVNFVAFDADQVIHPPKTEDVKTFYQPEIKDKDLFVAHNLSAENIVAAQELGGLAAPSLATARVGISDFTGFGEITLLADKELLKDPKAKTFDADIYSPRQPRAVYDIDQDIYSELYQQLDPDNLELSKPDINSMEDTTGPDNFLRSEAVEYHWLKLQGKEPKLKKAKVDSTVRKAAKIDKNQFDLIEDEKFIKMATDYYQKTLDALTEEGFNVRVEKMTEWYFNEDGSLKQSKLRDLASKADRFRRTGGIDTSKLREDIVKKIRVKKNRAEYEQWASEQFNKMVTGKKIFKGFTPSGNRKYVDYNMQNVVKEMTQQLQAGESFFYGAGTVRSKYANQMKTIKQIQAKRDEIVSEEDMQKVKDESADVFSKALDDLRPFYKFDSGSWGYSDDAGSAIIEGRKGLNEAFDMTSEAQQIVDDLLEYLVALPTSYFETKIQRSVGFEEFNTAIVPRGTRKDALKILKDAGLKIKTYDPKDKESRAGVIAKQEKLLFQPTRASIQFTKTNESIIRLTEASDLSSFLHESGHLFLEMEKRFADKFGTTEEQQALLDWLEVKSFDEIETEHHEKFAETFEVYLREGTSPSLKLREAFAAFSRWLTVIYQKITDSRLGRANLTPEIRQYMDRMLATEVEIEQAMANPAYDQLFRSAEQAGMTDDEWVAYQAQAAKAKDTATIDLNQKVIDELKRRKTKEWKEERAGIMDNELERLSELPAYKAMDLALESPMNSDMVKDELGIEAGMTTKERYAASANIDLEQDSLLVAAAKKGGLNMAVWSREFVDPEYLKDRAFNNQVFGRPIFRKNKGMTADDLAEMSNELGYTVDATAKDILDAVGRELSGDPVLTPEGIERKAEENYEEYYGDEYEPEVTDKKVKTRLERLLKWVTKKDGTDPSEYVDVFGYKSVTEMINDMNEAGNIKREAFKSAESLMIDKYGDMLNDGRIELEAREAVHNDEQAKLLLHEIRALSKKKSPINREYLKAKAKDLISGMTYKQMKPNKFYRAEIKAAQEAAVATTDEEKLAAKTKQIANHYLYREATDAKENAQKMRKHIRSVEQRKYSANQVHPEYIRQLKLYTVASDFRVNTKMTEAQAIEKLRSIANWANAQRDESIGLEINLYDENLNMILEADKLGLLSEVKLKAWDEMTNAELSGIYMMTKHLRTIGGRMSDEVKMKKKAHFQSVADSILENAVRPKRAPKGTKARDVQEIRKSYAADVFLHTDSVLRRLDGFKDNGAVYNAIKRPLDDAIAKVQIPLQEEAGEAMDRIYHDHYSDKELRKMNGQVITNGHDLALTKWEVMMMAANYGTESNREALYDSKIEGEMPYTEELVKDALDQHMTKNDWDFIEDMWAYTETYRGRLFALERKRKGVAPPAVEGIPVQTKFGEIKGRYHPLSYDSADSWKVTEDEAEDLFRGVSMGHYAKAQTNDGMLKERVGSGGRPVNLSPSAWHSAINKNINLIALGEAVEEVQSVMASPDVNAAMLETGNLAYLKALDVWLKDVAAGEVVAQDGVSRVARSIRTGFSVSAIGLNFGTILLQPLGLFQSMPIVGYGKLLKGVSKLIKNPSKVIEDTQSDNPFMRERGLTFNKDIRDTMNALHGNPNRPSYIPQVVQDSLFYGIIWTQKYVDAATWLAAHDKAEAEFGPEATEDDYKHYANRAVARTQASGIWADRTPIERGTMGAKVRQAEIVRMWTGLASYFFAKGNIAAELFTKTKFKDPVEAAKFAADMMVLFTTEVVIVAFMKNLWPDEKDDETYAGYLAKETAVAALSTLPLIREFASMINGFAGGTTTMNYYKALADVTTQAGQGDVDLAFFKAMNTVGGMTFKYPSGAINRFVDAEYKRQIGKDVEPIDYLMWRKKDK